MRRFIPDKYIAVLLVLFAVSLATSYAHTAVNPFTTPPSKQQDTERKVERPQGSEKGGWSFFGGLLRRSADLQMKIRTKMAGFARDIKESPFGKSFRMFILAAFGYGVFHAVGPGHGKLLAMSYFLNRPGRIKTCLLFGYATMTAHVLSAAVLVLVGFYILKISASGTVDSYTTILQPFSYGLIFLLGAFLTLKTILSIFRKSSHSGHEHAPPEAGEDRKTLVLMALAAGMIPCPGATIVLLFALTMNIMIAGLFAMLAISLGMGMTLSLCAAAVVITRGVALRFIKGREHTYKILHIGLSLLGSTIIMLFGAVLFAGAVFG